MLTDQIRNIILRCESELYICNKSSTPPSTSSSSNGDGIEIVDPLVAVEPEVTLEDIIEFSKVLSQVSWSFYVWRIRAGVKGQEQLNYSL